ncbi:MAG TPA: glycosyltransferase family 2 protein [Acetobacteraceae bacterium]|nr:glycosyltransferase family 2 protein [Acetobacteraceae bacterium]
MRVAALTMAFNEPVWARVWSRFYARQVGAANCFLLDHGSDDGSTEGLGITVERLERSPLDEDARAALVGARAAELLRHYDVVVHTDTDELLLPDPARHADLVAFAAAVSEPVVTAAGLDLQHLPEREPPLDPARPIGAQREWVRFSAAMCKPAFIRRPVRWAPGFHTSDAPMVMAGLYLIHLRYADLGLGLRRLARTRSQAFANEGTNLHQRVPDSDFEDMVRAIAQLQPERFELDAARPPLRDWLKRVRAGRKTGGPWLNLAGDHLWQLPDRVRALF